MTTAVAADVDQETFITDQQLVLSMRFGRKVTLHMPELDPSSLTGYIVSFDKTNIRIAVVRVDDHGQYVDNLLRNRSFIAGFDFSDASTKAEEAVADDLESMIKGFRERALRLYFPQQRQR